jgi:hypothetical protein
LLRRAEGFLGKVYSKCLSVSTDTPPSPLVSWNHGVSGIFFASVFEK